MSNLAKLKKKAADLEERRNYDKALAVYEQVLQQMEDSDEEVDVALFNRVGDLTLRHGRVTEAVTHYEKAVDLYSEGGFFNNAIALCNKILRNAPGRTSVYYKLGKISARKGFTSDAKANFLEYADRMQKSGHWEEAFSALKEFADLCPDQDDVRLMLAEQLTRKERNTEALEQLQILYGRYVAEERTTEASATLERMRALDPEIVPHVEQRSAPDKNGGLVFLDVSYDGPISNAPSVRPSRDPRLSGDLQRIPDPDEEDAIVSPLPLLQDVNLPVGNLEGLSGNLPPSETRPTTAAEELPSALHDLALAGILPVLDTPGIAPEVEPPEVTPADSPEKSAGSTLSEMEALSPFERAEREASDTPDYIPVVELLDIDKPMDGRIDLDDSGSKSDLRIIHGSGSYPGVPDGDHGADSLLGGATSDASTEDQVELTTALSRDSLKAIASTIPEVLSLLRTEPDDMALRRRLGELLVEDGQRAEGLAELDAAMVGAESAGDVGQALSIVEELIRLEPNSVKHHQKRVEYAFRSNDQTSLVDAYLELADALFRTEQLPKARVVYERVLGLAPDNRRARGAMVALGGRDSDAEKRADLSVTSNNTEREGATAAIAVESAESFVNLGDLLREDDEPRSTRMVVDEEEPSGDEEADFAEMLDKFKRRLAENVDDEDYESHYDLGVAFREMGLLDEAIAQFQRALRGTGNRIRTLEALGQCFVERSRFQVAANVLERALSEGEGDENLVGVLYLLGYSYEALKNYSKANEYYQRVFMVDIQFRDVTERISALEKMIE